LDIGQETETGQIIKNVEKTNRKLKRKPYFALLKIQNEYRDLMDS
jgi:hypothetical protein